MWSRCGHGRGAFQSVHGPTLPVFRKTKPHTRTLGNFREHLTYQVVSGIRLCNRDTCKRTAGSVGFAVLSEATPTSTLTPSKESMSSTLIIGALLQAYASIVGVFEFAILPNEVAPCSVAQMPTRKHWDLHPRCQAWARMV